MRYLHLGKYYVNLEMAKSKGNRFVVRKCADKQF